MRRVLTAVAGLLVAGTILTTTASATPALWRQMDTGWRIVGDTQIGTCAMSGSFPGGDISLAYTTKYETWHMGFGRIQNYWEGDKYSGRIRASNGRVWILDEGVGSGGQIIFSGLKTDFVYEIARTRGIDVEGVGKFSMYGSAQAIRETIKCAYAVSGLTS